MNIYSFAEKRRHMPLTLLTFVCVVAGRKIGCSAVHYSCKAADLSSLGKLLEHGARTNVFDNAGMAPIHYAAEEHFWDTLTLLLCYGVDVNLKNKITGMTALHYACEFNNINVMKFLLYCGADYRLQDNTRKCPDIGPTLVQDNLEIQQAFKERKIITFGKMIKRMERHVFSQANVTLENMNTDSMEFSFFCRTMPIEFVNTDTIFSSNLSEYLKYRSMEAVSDVYGYVVNQRVTDVTVTVPIYSTPDKFDDIFVHATAGGQTYECQEIRQTREGRFAVSRMTFEVDRDNIMSFIVMKKRKTDRHVVDGRKQTLVSSVEDKFVVCIPAKCLPKDSSVELKVHKTDGFNNTLNTSSFCEIITDHILLEHLSLQLPCPTQGSTNESFTSSVYNSQDEGMTWVDVDSEVADTGDAVKVLDKPICNGTGNRTIITATLLLRHGRFAVSRMTFEVDRDNIMSFIVMKKRKTDRHVVDGRKQTLVSSVEDKFVVCIPAKCLPKDSSVELKVHKTDGFNNTLNTSSFCEIITDHILLEHLSLQLPCPTQGSTNESFTSSVYNSQDEGMTWVDVDSEVADTGDAVKVLDKPICNGTYIVTESTQKQTKHISSWIKHFLKWLYSEIITRKKHCSFMAMTKQVREDEFKLLVLLTDEKTSDSLLNKWKNVNYITQISQMRSGYTCRPGQMFTVEVDTDSNSVVGSSSLELCYQSGRESHQEFIINGKHHDLVVVYVRKHGTKKPQMGKTKRGILTQINVDLVKENDNGNTVVKYKFDEYPDNRCLSWLADELGYKWAIVGVSLGLNYSYLESIEMGNSARRTNLTMLCAWRKKLALDIQYIHGVDTLVSCLILAGRYDLATEIRKQVKQLIKHAPSERICKCVESFPNYAECLLGELHEAKGASVDTDRIRDSYAVISPFRDRFLVIIVIVIGFNLSVLYQLGVSQDRIEHINHQIKDSEAAMFKCLIVAKRDYRDDATFVDELLKALKHDKNNQAILDIRQMCMKWLGLKTRKTDTRTQRLENVLDKYCAST